MSPLTHTLAPGRPHPLGATPRDGQLWLRRMWQKVRSKLRRLGVLSHAALLADRFPVPWRLLLRALRGMELRGEVRGGRFVTGLAGEQYALATAVAPLRGAAKAHALQAQ